jgi:hypothetical protein
MMGFSELERVNIAAKALQAGVVDANPNSVWYEVFNPFTFVLAAEQVWTEMTRLRALPASNLTTAQANAVANPNLIQDRSDTASATLGARHQLLYLRFLCDAGRPLVGPTTELAAPTVGTATLGRSKQRVRYPAIQR